MEFHVRSNSAPCSSIVVARSSKVNRTMLASTTPRSVTALLVSPMVPMTSGSQFRFIVKMAKLLSLFHVIAFFPVSVLFSIWAAVNPSAGFLIAPTTIFQIEPPSWSHCSSVCSIESIHWAKLCCPARLGSILGEFFLLSWREVVAWWSWWLFLVGWRHWYLRILVRHSFRVTGYRRTCLRRYCGEVLVGLWLSTCGAVLFLSKQVGSEPPGYH